MNNLLLYILLFPIFGIIILWLIPSKEEKLLKIVALNATCLSFIGSLILWGFFQKTQGSFQFVCKLFWLSNSNLNFILGIDGISLFFLFLTTLLIPLCLMVSWNSVGNNLKEFLVAFLILDFFLIGTFCVLDLLLFYIFFESVLIPMFLIIGVWGSRERKILASYYFFFIYVIGFSSYVIIYCIYILSSGYY